MIYLLKNTANPISVDAPQIITEATPYFFFYFEDIQTQETYSGYIDRTNPTSERFGAFTITLPTDFALESGEYIYEVYESADEVETNRDNLTLLERGIASVSETIETNNFYNAPTLTGSTYANS